MSDPEIVVVGAGAAGLAAAALLRRARRRILVLEAGSVIGGRARTMRPAELSGAAIDAGATWLHETHRNPLVTLARAAGDRLHAAHQGGRLLLSDGGIATPAAERAYGAAEQAWGRAMTRAADGPDRSLAAASRDWAAPAPQAAWQANLEAWEGAIIAAADADDLSLHDWSRNQIGEGDLRPACGVGALLADRLGPLAGPVQCGTAVASIDWQAPGGVAVTTASGTIRAAACIVTVSTGVLRDGRIAFTPRLPAETLGALDGLPMGLLSKLAIPADAGIGLGPDIAPGMLIEARLVSRAEPMMLLGAWPDGAPYITGFFGGRHAWSFAGREAAALEEARARIGALLGQDALRALGPVGDRAGADGGFVSRWGSDPLFLGGYSYARPGHADARAALGRPLAGGRLVLAGEACRTDGLAGTVGGAIRDGERAARAVLHGLGDAGAWPGLAQDEPEPIPHDGYPPAPVRV